MHYLGSYGKNDKSEDETRRRVKRVEVTSIEKMGTKISRITILDKKPQKKKKKKKKEREKTKAEGSRVDMYKHKSPNNYANISRNEIIK